MCPCIIFQSKKFINFHPIQTGIISANNFSEMRQLPLLLPFVVATFHFILFLSFYFVFNYNAHRIHVRYSYKLFPASLPTVTDIFLLLTINESCLLSCLLELSLVSYCVQCSFPETSFLRIV